MIVPNLMVSDMARSVRFYRDTIGMTLTMTVSPEREVGWPGEASGAAFAVLEWDGAQLMLQTVESLAGELAVFAPDHAPAPSGTIYFRGLHPGSVRDRVAAEDVVKGPERSWYGMMELYVRDPDGYVICVGAPEGGAVGLRISGPTIREVTDRILEEHVEVRCKPKTARTARSVANYAGSHAWTPVYTESRS
ncbi:MAG: VOC family protein [Chloroflexota bacterium]|nr:VOC family protein [Chloroflexota bacterium]